MLFKYLIQTVIVYVWGRVMGLGRKGELEIIMLDYVRIINLCGFLI